MIPTDSNDDANGNDDMNWILVCSGGKNTPLRKANTEQQTRAREVNRSAKTVVRTMMGFQGNCDERHGGSQVHD
jgi:hypothetical protein